VLLTQAEWEARQKVSGESSGGGRNHGSGRGRGHGSGGGSSGRGSIGGGGTEGAGRRDKSHIKYFKCKEYWHYANRCPSEKKKDEEAHHVKKVEFEATVLMAETVEPGQPKCLLSKNIQAQEMVCLNEVHLASELHFTRDGVKW